MDEASSQFSLDVPMDTVNPEENIDDILEQLESKKTQKVTIWPKLLGWMLSTNMIDNVDDILDHLLKDRVNEYTARCFAIAYLFTDHGLRDSVNFLLRDIQNDSHHSIALLSATFIVFVASEDEESTLKLISVLQTQIRKSDKKHKTAPLSLMAALTSIFVLATTIEDDDFIRIAKDVTPDLIFYMEQPDLELSLTSAEILAYIYQHFSGIKVGFEYKSKMLQILDAKMALVSKLTGKKDKLTVVRRLKAVMGTISTSKGPAVKPLKHEGKLFLMEDWTSYLRMRLLRIVLGSGLYHHLTIHHIFESMFTVTEDTKLDRLALHNLRLQQKDRDAKVSSERFQKTESYFGE